MRRAAATTPGGSLRGAAATTPAEVDVQVDVQVDVRSGANWPRRAAKTAKWRELAAKWREDCEVARSGESGGRSTTYCPRKTAATFRESGGRRTTYCNRPGKTVENLHGDSESLGEIREIHARPCQTPQKSSQSLRYNSASRWIKKQGQVGAGGGLNPKPQLSSLNPNPIKPQVDPIKLKP